MSAMQDQAIAEDELSAMIGEFSKPYIIEFGPPPEHVAALRNTDPANRVSVTPTADGAVFIDSALDTPAREFWSGPCFFAGEAIVQLKGKLLDYAANTPGAMLWWLEKPEVCYFDNSQSRDSPHSGWKTYCRLAIGDGNVAKFPDVNGDAADGASARKN